MRGSLAGARRAVPQGPNCLALAFMKDRDIDLISSVDGSTNGGVPPPKNPLSVAAIGLARIGAILAGKRRRRKAMTAPRPHQADWLHRRASDDELHQSLEIATH